MNGIVSLYANTITLMARSSDMNLPLEVAQVLHSNETARLRCHRRCPEAKTCIGLEVHTLSKLQLLEEVGNGLNLTRLGTEVNNQNLISIGATSVPKLID
jgi:hypothetical protein